MPPAFLLPCLLAALPGAAPHAQGRPAPEVREFGVPSLPSRGRVWLAPGEDGSLHTFTSVSLDGRTFSPPRETSYELELRYRRFDPRTEEVEVPGMLRARESNRLFVVQYWTQGLEDYRTALRSMGVETRLFLANNGNVVDMDPARVADVRALPFVRAVTPFQPAYKLEEELLAGVLEARTGPLKVNLLTTTEAAGTAVVAWVLAHGGSVEEVSPETSFMTASIAYELLPELVGMDQVQFVDRWGPRVPCMDIAREFHGANYVEAVHGLTGTDVRVEVLDFGCDTSHPDLQNFLVHNGNSPGDHGTCTSGIVTGDGIGGRPAARGAAPDSFLIIGDLDFPYGGSAHTRYSHTQQLVNSTYRCVLQSNSWISLPETNAYSTTAGALDKILFDFQRISIVTAQGNSGTNVCGREAWAKNVISVGALIHHNTLTDTDDNWGGGASCGPAADGRIKPDVASFYDNILCTDEVGSAGYTNGSYFNGFGGTSGATPITAGHLALIYQMWHQGLFGNPHPGPTPFDNAPNNTTAKALLINSATQWTFSGTNVDRRRMHQGWGHADLEKLSNALPRMLVVDETDVLANLQSKSYTVQVLPGEPSMEATLVYRDPNGTVSSTQHRINDLDLTLTSPSSVVYHGNNGLTANMTSTAGGTADTKNTVENVILDNPQSGLWTVTVTASELNQDSHVETPGLDADYALVVRGAKELTLPAAPAHLRGRASAHEAHLAFHDNSDNEDGFALERSLDGVTFLPLATLAADDHEHVDPGLTPGTTYHYRVRAFNALGNSGWSNVLVLRTNKADER